MIETCSYCGQEGEFELDGQSWCCPHCGWERGLYERMQVAERDRSKSGVCPNCGSAEAEKVRWTWWGGFVAPRLLNQVRCRECGTTYRGKTGKFRRRTLMALGIVGLVAIAGLALLAYFVPEMRVLARNEIPARFERRLVSHGIIDDPADIVYLYSAGLYDVQEVYIATKDRLIMYRHGSVMPLRVVNFEDIAEISLYKSDSWAEGSHLIVTTVDDENYVVPLSPEVDGDERFYMHVKEKASRLNKNTGAERTGDSAGFKK